MKTMSIDYIRELIENTLEEEHLKNHDYFGGKDQVNLFSFYEQLQEDYEVDRYTELYRDLVNQQNRSGLIMNGTIVAPENPQMMNTHNHTIIPLTYNVSFRVALKDRDLALATIDNLFKVLKGRKQDVAEIENGKLLEVGTIANNVSGTPTLESGCFIGELADMQDINSEVTAKLNEIRTAFGNDVVFNGTYYYFEFDSKIYKTIHDADTDTWSLDETFEYSGMLFTKNKVSISFDSIRIDEPKTLNAQEYITIMFGGSATLTDGNVVLGNQLTKVGIKKYKVQAQTDIAITDTYHWLEPLEIPSGLGISGEISQLASHNFIQNTHNDGIKATIDYSFVLDFAEPLIKQWWKYARYGIQGTHTDSYSNGVSPNMLYQVREIWSSWGNIEVYDFIAKATDNIDIENTESDALTIRITLDIQRE